MLLYYTILYPQQLWEKFGDGTFWQEMHSALAGEEQVPCQATVVVTGQPCTCKMRSYSRV